MLAAGAEQGLINVVIEINLAQLFHRNVPLFDRPAGFIATEI